MKKIIALISIIMVFASESLASTEISYSVNTELKMDKDSSAQKYRNTLTNTKSKIENFLLPGTIVIDFKNSLNKDPMQVMIGDLEFVYKVDFKIQRVFMAISKLNGNDVYGKVYGEDAQLGVPWAVYSEKGMISFDNMPIGYDSEDVQNVMRKAEKELGPLKIVISQGRELTVVWGKR